jgi:drug/metabolite transporter (DMT)-like permease
MGNLDFTHNAGFSWYCLLLLISGIALLVLGPLKGIPKNAKLVNVLCGAGFLAYGLYMTFLFQGTSYFVLFKLFVVPVLLIVNSIRAARTKPSPAPVAFTPMPQQDGAPQAPQWPVGR